MRLTIAIVTILAICSIFYFRTVAHTSESKDATVTKDIVYGHPTNGLAININFEHPKYYLNEDIECIVTLKNIGNDPLTIFGADPYGQYRMALFDQDGHPVAKSKRLIAAENGRPVKKDASSLEIAASKIGGGSINYQVLNPGLQIKTTMIITDWFDIEHAGTYQLVVMRQCALSWDQGFVISNLASIVIADPENSDKNK
jgi:hypothetical protein